MSLVQGKNVVLMFYDNGGWRMYACAKSATISVDTSTIETSTTGSGAFATFEGQKHTWTVTCDGVVNLNSDSMLTLPDLRQRQIAFIKMLINYERTDQDGNVYTDQGLCLITNSSDTGSINDVATFSLSLQGTGPLTQIFTPTNLELSAVRIYPPIDNTTSFAGGEVSITIALLIGKDILDFSMDGISFYTIITTGTPVSKQVLYESATGTFQWEIPAEPGQTYKIEYQDI